MSVRMTGMQNDRELFEVTIRKEYAAEDYAEMVAIQENSLGKKRFIVCFEDFGESDITEFVEYIKFDNYFRNTFIRKNRFVTCAFIQ